MNKHPDIHTLLSTWGKRNRSLPSKNEQIKEVVFTAFQSMPGLAAARPARAGRTPWLSLGFAGMAALAFLVTSTGLWPVQYKGTPARMEGGSAQGVAEPAAGYDVPMDSAANREMMPPYYPYPQGEVPATDTREFLRTSYSATLRTRRVEDLTRRVELIVRGMSGRVDYSNSSKEYGSVNFTVPADRFEAFRAEVKSMVGDRFIMENVSRENLLPQKRSIEEQQADIQKNLDAAKARRTGLVATHNKASAALRSRLTDIAYEMEILQSDTTTDPARRAQNQYRIQQLQNEQSSVNAQLSSENASYARQLAAADSEISGWQNALDGVKKQDQNLMDNVATVSGTISLQWVSVWGILDLYLPEQWPSILFVIAAIVSYILHRRKMRAITI